MKQELGYFLKNAKFRAALGLTLLLSYGYAIATTRVSIDSLEGERYIGTGGVMLDVYKRQPRAARLPFFCGGRQDVERHHTGDS